MVFVRVPSYFNWPLPCSLNVLEIALFKINAALKRVVSLKEDKFYIRYVAEAVNDWPFTDEF